MKVLVIGPHPDDLEYGCGGTLVKFKKQGAHIFLLVMTRGEIGGNLKTRRQEQSVSARLLGADIFWGGCRDTRVVADRKAILRVEQVIRKVQPDLVLANYREDTHQDHRATAQIVMSATRHLRNVLFFEVPTTQNFLPSVFVDIGGVLELKFDLLRSHRSQMHETKVESLDIVESAKACAIFRGFQDRVKYAEGFVPLRFSLDGWYMKTTASSRR